MSLGLYTYVCTVNRYIPADTLYYSVGRSTTTRYFRTTDFYLTYYNCGSGFTPWQKGKKRENMLHNCVMEFDRQTHATYLLACNVIIVIFVPFLRYLRARLTLRPPFAVKEEQNASCCCIFWQIFLFQTLVSPIVMFMHTMHRHVVFTTAIVRTKHAFIGWYRIFISDFSHMIILLTLFSIVILWLSDWKTLIDIVGHPKFYKYLDSLQWPIEISTSQFFVLFLRVLFKW